MSVREVLTVLIVFAVVLTLLLVFGVTFWLSLIVASLGALLAALLLSYGPRLR